MTEKPYLCSKNRYLQSGVSCQYIKMALFHGKMAKHLCMWKKCCNFAAFYKDRTNILQQQTVRFSRVNPVNLLIRRKKRQFGAS